MRSGNKAIFPAALLALLMAAPAGAAEEPVLGEAYVVDGVTYKPADLQRLDEIGYATALPEAADGQRTASGEVYAPGAVAAAHRVLPLPSYVEVTAVDSGKTILVRINDRGPMRNDRILALSPGALRQLGVAAQDRIAVRVRRVSPLEQERAILAAGGEVAPRMDAPAGLRAALARRLPDGEAAAPATVVSPTTLAAAPIIPPSAKPPAPVVAPAKKPVEPVRLAKPVMPAEPAATIAVAGPAMPPVARPVPPKPAPAPKAVKTGAYVVQVAALSSRDRADALARSLGGHVAPAGKLFRVRTGPHAGQAEARAALGGIRAKGYADAQVVVNDGGTAAALAGR